MNKPYIPPEAGLKLITARDRQTSPWAGACFALFISAGFLTTIYSSVFGSLNLFPGTVSWSAFIKGDTSQRFASALADAPVPSEAASLERGTSWVLARDLGARVRSGSPGWLFLMDEFTVHAQASSQTRTRAENVIAVEQKLAQAGIKLLVVVVPDKSRIESNHLGSLYRPAAFASRLQDWVATLQTARINVLDLTPVLSALHAQKGAAYYQTDSHWTESGAQAAAVEVARRVQALKLNITPVQNVDVATLPRALRPGDLVKLAGVQWLPLSLQPQPESAQKSTFKVQTSPAMGQPAADAAADDLFGDSDLPVIAVIGTSFSRTSNFVPFLEAALHTKIGNFARDGGDFSGAANAYFNGASFKETPPKLVIWEIPERVLQQDAKADGVRSCGSSGCEK